MIIDLHTHTRFGSNCSYLYPGELVQSAKRLGLDGAMFRPYLPSKDLPGGFNGLQWSRSFRAHIPGVEEFLEEWYDRSAENCDLFINISEVDKYSITCTVCCYFESGGCGCPDVKGPSIIELLKASYNHDGLAWG